MIIGSGYATTYDRTILCGLCGRGEEHQTLPRLDAEQRWPHVKTLSELPFWMGNLYILSIYVMINKKCAALRMYKCMGGPLGPPKNVCSLWLHKIPFCLTEKNISVIVVISSLHPMQLICTNTGYHSIELSI